VIRYGIVGIGGFAATWVRGLQTLEERGLARLSAAVVRDPAKYAAQTAEMAARGVAFYPTLEEMLARGRGQIDIIGVPTGIGYHEPMAVQALEAGYPVLIEKPVAGTVQEVASIAAAERRSGQWCGVGYQWLHSPAMQHIKSVLDSGALGSLREGRSVIGWPRPYSYYARNPWAGQLWANNRWILDGPLTNAVAHYLVNMTYLAGVRRGGGVSVAAVRGEYYRAKPIPSYDTSAVEVTLSSGVRLYHYVSHSLQRAYEPKMLLLCERGRVTWTAQDDTALIRYADGREERFANPEPQFNEARPMAQAARVLAGEEPSPLCGLVEGGVQVLAVDLAFESSGGIAPIPRELVYEVTAPDGSALICARGMEELLAKAQQQGGLFSDLGAPWAVATPRVAAAGYDRFPQSATLEQALLRDRAAGGD
jgi:predicted dehydrogenase